ncbi:MAG: hypothetical protein KDA44_17175 [Planctomycetales bacterium]|nr:hypothetical protein [Planctomycetales bacterium]
MKGLGWTATKVTKDVVCKGSVVIAPTLFAIVALMTYGSISLAFSMPFGVFLVLAVRAATKSWWLPCVFFSLVAMTFFWMCCVHAKYDEMYCPVCGSRESSRRSLEVLKIELIEESRRFPSVMSLVADDLGCPCPHKQIENTTYYDYWGLFLRFGDTEYLTGVEPPETPTPDSLETRYRGSAAAHVAEFLRNHPDQVRTFCERAIREGNREFGYWFIYNVLELPEF